MVTMKQTITSQLIIFTILMVLTMLKAQTTNLTQIKLGNDTEKKISIKQAKIKISIKDQKLYLISNDSTAKEYDISTSKYGVGNESNSNKTPLGKHKIKNMYGKDAALGTIFKGRANTGKIATINTDSVFRETDLVTTRIMWLDGKEESNKNSYLRYIYIHGTPEEGLIGTPSSHGCIRMKNSDVIELFEKVKIGTVVEIFKNSVN